MVLDVLQARSLDAANELFLHLFIIHNECVTSCEAAACCAAHTDSICTCGLQIVVGNICSVLLTREKHMTHEAEDEITKMADCLSARRIRGKNGDEVRTKRKVQCTSCAWSNVIQMRGRNLESQIRKHFSHDVIVVVVAVVVVAAATAGVVVVVVVVAAVPVVVVLVMTVIVSSSSSSSSNSSSSGGSSGSSSSNSSGGGGGGSSSSSCCCISSSSTTTTTATI